MILGLISNLHSRGNRRQPPELPAVGGSKVKLLHRTLEGVSGMEEALGDLAAEGAEVVAVNGGDGSVSAVLTGLLENSPFERTPALAVLSGGTLNMTSADVGLKGSVGAALGRLATRVAEPEWDHGALERDVLRVSYDPGKMPVCGMFFGTAVIYRAVVLTCERMQPLGLGPSTAAFATLVYLLGRHWIKGGGEDDLVRGDEMAVRLDGGPGQRVTQLLALVTTLDRLVLGSRPFWGQEQGALHYTGIAYPTHRLLRSALRVLYGGAERRLPPSHYVSHNVDRVAFEMDCSFTLDGELYTPASGTPVEVGSGGRVKFVQC
ncbi:MAG: diacylglycerol kinase family protein [Rhodospirillales bacterium]|nr:diacylglycerol kinase family protein [Rhodospirillales bacterium]